MMKRAYKRKSQPENPNTSMQTPHKSDDYDSRVTGVSRSGRVRKKSSKLIDYEEPGTEEQDKCKRKSEAVGYKNTPRGGIIKMPVQHIKEHDRMNQPSGNSNSTQDFSDSESEPNAFGSNDDYIDSSGDSSADEFNDEISDDGIEGTSYNRSSIGSNSSKQKSMYMNEKSYKSKNKKLKKGRIRKAERKDKGKARYSAYMLWAKEVRPQLMKNNPNTDFPNIKSKLSEMWATLRPNDKYMWKQKAKRMSILARNNDCTEETNVQKGEIPKKYNKQKPTVKDDSKLADNSGSLEENSSAVDNKPYNLGPPNTALLDISAHLSLLGESLTTIGDRLKEHKGEIAVSGSLSVLLDSLLCSIGPLLCATQQFDEMNGCPQETLSSILDNIAYIMPGL